VNSGLPARTWADFRVCRRQAFAFHLGLQLLGVALFTPLVTWTARHIVTATGEAVVSNFDLATFALSLRGALFVLVVAALTLGLLFAEFAGLSWLSGHAIARRPVTAISTIGFVTRKLPHLVALAAIVFARLSCCSCCRSWL